jgi:hypothetical protein
MTAGGNLAWSAANIGGPGKLFVVVDLDYAPFNEAVVCGWSYCFLVHYDRL